MRLNRLTRPALVPLVALLMSSASLSSAARRPSGAMNCWLNSQAWEREFNACVDPQVRPNSVKIRAFISHAEAARAAIKDKEQNWQKLAILERLAVAHDALHEWNQAEACDLASLAKIDQDRDQWDDAGDSEECSWYEWYLESADRDLAAVRGAQRRWGAASRYFLLWAFWDVRNSYETYVFASYGLLALWAMLGWRNERLRRTLRIWSTLSLFASVPFMFAALEIGARVITHALLNGNPFSQPLYPYAVVEGTIVRATWTLLMILGSIRYRRSQWQRESSPGREESAADIAPESSSTDLRSWRLTRLYVAVGLVGWALLHAGHEVSTIFEMLCLPQTMAWWRHSGRLSAAWICDLTLAFTFASWVQELFFRGVVYRYAREVFGAGFAILFSSTVFAAWHGQPDSFGYYFWIGVVFTAQYEVGGSLLPGTVCHCLHNFFSLIRPPV